jgi:acetyltransferase-like isoleucine patch superfamily enzyme
MAGAGGEERPIDGHIQTSPNADNNGPSHSFFANFNFTVLDCGLVTIGNTVLLGPNVSIMNATHETEVQSRRENIEYAKKVVIGDDCWIGGHVVILPGVTIGQGCTIAAGAVVTKDIPAWSVAMGVPARVVKKVTPVEG